MSYVIALVVWIIATSWRLIKEIPADSKSQCTVVKGVVRGEEVVPFPWSCIHVAQHDEEAGMLQVHVSVDVDNRIVTRLYATFTLLNGVLSQGRTVIGGIEAGKVSQVGTDIEVENFGVREMEI